MATLSNFQKTKILRVFTMLYDTNNDGVIEKQDFDMLLEKVSVTLNWPKDGDKHTNARDTLNTVWEGLMAYADTNKDAKITKDEWLKMWTDCLKDIEQGHFPGWQKKYMDLMFDVNDMSGDEFIDMSEYTTFFTQFELSAEQCQEAFQLISGGSNITRAQFAGLWKEYLTSNDPEAPGNFLFGPKLE